MGNQVTEKCIQQLLRGLYHRQRWQQNRSCNLHRSPVTCPICSFGCCWILALETPRKTIFFAIALLLFCAFDLSQAILKADYELFFNGENKRLKVHRTIENLYGRQDSIRILIALPEKEAFDPIVLNHVQQLTELAWKIPYSNRVSSLSNYPYVKLDELDNIVEDLFSSDLESAEIQRRKAYALNDIEAVDEAHRPR